MSWARFRSDAAPLRPAPRLSTGGVPRWSALAVCGTILLVVLTGCRERSDVPSTRTIVELTDGNFQREVLEADQPVLVEFWAPWCQPCVEMAPAIEQVAEEFSGQVKVGRLRIDGNADLASSFNVEAPPALLLFQQGEITKRRFGRQTAESLRKLLAEVLARDEALESEQR